ncbi:MAG: metallophosphoesterase, partial [Bacteroidales bacterium]|nr:metallophosphoesterase [Bacteroidales bacterium]
MRRLLFFSLLAGLLFSGCSSREKYSVVILGDTHYDAADPEFYHAGYTDPKPSREAAHRLEFIRNGNMWADRSLRLIDRAAGLVDKDTRYVLQVGDLIQGDTADSTTHVRFLDDAVNLIKSHVAPDLPFVSVNGNHDRRGVDDALCRRAYKAYMMPRVSQELGQEITHTSYLFRQGPDAFVAINYASTNLEGIKSLLEEARGSRHVFVLIHTPVFPFDDPDIFHWFFLGKRDDSRAQERREMRALLASLNAIVLCGHTHDTELLDWEGDGGRITQMTMSSVWEADSLATYTVKHSGADEYPHYGPIFDEYRPG